MTVARLQGTAHLAAMHRALWEADSWYKYAWLAWPSALALAAMGWLLAAPAPPAASWGRPATGKEAQPASGAPAATQAPSPVVSADAQACSNATLAARARLEACHRALGEQGIANALRVVLLVNRAEARRVLNEPLANVIGDFAEALKIEPDNFAAVNNRGNYYISLGRYAEALPDINRAQQLQPNSPLPYYNRGRIAAAQGNNEQAIADFTAAVQRPGVPNDVYYQRGDALTARGQFDAALRDYDENVKLFPRESEAYRRRSWAKVQLGRQDEAIADAGEALRFFPQNTLALGNRAIAYFLKGNYQQAVADTSEALRIAPNYAYGHEVRGRAYLELGRSQEALADLDKSIVHLKSVVSWQARGRAAYELGGYQRAGADFLEAEKLQPNNAYTQFLLGLNAEQGENARVASCISGGANVPETLRTHGSSDGCSRTPDYATALRYFGRSVELSDNFVQALFARSRILLAQGKANEAAADVARGLQVAPRHVDGLVARGNVAMARGQYSDAIADYSAAHSQNQRAFIALHNRAIAYQRLNDRKRAIEDLRAALQINPSYEPAKALLRSLGERI